MSMQGWGGLTGGRGVVRKVSVVGNGKRWYTKGREREGEEGTKEEMNRGWAKG